jgi:hypothetical protein
MDRSVRLLLLWEHPRLSSADEARSWAEREISPLGANERIERLELIPLRAAGDHVSHFDWLLELRVRSRYEAAELLREAPLADLLGELRSLGLGPIVLVADEADATHGER